VLALDRHVAADLRQQARRGDAGHRARLAHARLRDRERRIVGLRGLDPRVELRVAVRAPPVADGPLRVGVRGADRGTGVKRGRVGAPRLRGDASGTGTSGDYQRERKNGERGIAWPYRKLHDSLLLPA